MNTRQSYAPTPHSYVPNTSLSATINLDEEVTLTTTRAERDLQDSLGELFSIIVTLDELEKAFLKDAIPEAEYTDICERSLRQYKALLADETIAAEFRDLEHFKAKWEVLPLLLLLHLLLLNSKQWKKKKKKKKQFPANKQSKLDVPRATERLRVGMPSTTVTASSTAPSSASTAAAAAAAAGNNPSGVLILEATQEFITFLDAVKLGLLSKDQLHPLLSDVIQSVNRVTDKDFDSRGKIVQWLITLNQMKASDELSEQQARELELDIQQAYQGFRRTLT
ncbi:Vacuolar protein sorting-associated protein 28 [Trichoderma ghanense]|uniref:Vacuolar protein sorting-associated protein 28 n=1 Tax=Trichoderma ghanense TaxID=65468 RepID=A0ABY2H3Q4_9HYPO